MTGYDDLENNSASLNGEGQSDTQASCKGSGSYVEVVEG